MNGVGQSKAGGISPQQALSAVKVEPQSLVHSSHQQLLIPKMEVKSELDLDQKVGQHALQRSVNNIGLSTPELQLQEALLQRQQAKQMQAQLSALQQQQQQRLLQGLPQQQQHLHDTTSLQLQQQLQHHHQQLQLQQQQASFLQSAVQEKNRCSWRRGEYPQ